MMESVRRPTGDFSVFYGRGIVYRAGSADAPSA
jgi:hypothetical protein